MPWCVTSLHGMIFGASRRMYFPPWNSMLTKFGNFIDADEDWQDTSERLERKSEVVL